MRGVALGSFVLMFSMIGFRAPRSLTMGDTIIVPTRVTVPWRKAQSSHGSDSQTHNENSFHQI